MDILKTPPFVIPLILFKQIQKSPASASKGDGEPVGPAAMSMQARTMWSVNRKVRVTGLIVVKECDFSMLNDL